MCVGALRISVVLLLACAPLDAHRDQCGPSGSCPEGRQCYRGFCIAADEVGADPITFEWDASLVLGEQPSVDGLGSQIDREDASVAFATSDAGDAAASQPPDARPSSPGTTTAASAALDASQGATVVDGPKDGAPGLSVVPSAPAAPDGSLAAVVQPPPVLATPPSDGRPPVVEPPPSTAPSAPPPPASSGASCSHEGSTAECASNSVCRQIRGGEKQCLRICSNKSDCPPQSSCAGVPGTKLKACEPK